MNELRKFRFIILIAILLISACKNDLNTNVKTKVLGHRANGIIGFNDTIMDNTLLSVIKAIETTDGVEIDIQMSKDGTIWLYHDPQFLNSDSLLLSIPQLNDNETLQQFNLLHPNTKFNTLQDVFEYFYQHKINKIISLDVKKVFNKNIFENGYATKNYLNNIVDEILKLARKYDVEDLLLIESDSKYLLNYVHEKSKIKTYFLGFGNFNKIMELALENNYDGLSHKFSDPEINKEVILLARKKGLSIQLWTPNSKSDLEYVLSLNPDYIQTDNIAYFKDSLIQTDND